MIGPWTYIALCLVMKGEQAAPVAVRAAGHREEVRGGPAAGDQAVRSAGLDTH